MKYLLYSLAVFALVAMCATPMQQVAQAAGDTLVVLATPPGNINDVINGDTLAGGVRAHPDRVYKLRRGTVYQVTAPIKVNGSLHIIANDSTSGGVPIRPPVLAPAILIDNTSVDHFFEFTGKGANVTMDNLYLLSVRVDQAWLGWSAAIRIWADSVYLRLRGMIFDAWSESGIRVYAHWTKLDVQDCIFRNHQHSTSYFGGQPYMTDAPNHLDTVKFINNTFFCNNSYLWSIRGYDVKSIFEHNTLVYGTVNPFLTRQGTHLTIKNNLFYAMHAYGGTPQHLWEAWFLNWPDTSASPIIQIRANCTWNDQAATGPEVYLDSAHGVYANMVLPQNRSIDLRNNAYFFPPKLMNFIQTYSDTTTRYDSLDYPISGGRGWVKRILYPAMWINPLVRATLDSIIPAQGGQVIESGNISADPGFNAAVENHLDKLIAYVDKIPREKLDSTWHFKPSGVLYPPTWPLPENLAYTNVALQSAGTDGFAAGDLNWFPTQKAQWLLLDVKPVDQLPQEFALSQNYPNPFNPSTSIQVTLSSAEHVRLVVYNMLGQKVKTLADQEIPAGSYVATWDGRDDRGMQLASGAYYYRLETKSFTKTRSMMLLK